MVVAVSPDYDDLPGIIQIPEQVFVQAGIAEDGIEAPHKDVLSRLAGLDILTHSYG